MRMLHRPQTHALKGPVCMESQIPQLEGGFSELVPTQPTTPASAALAQSGQRAGEA